MDGLKFKQSWATSVYLSEGGYLVIRQDNFPEEEDLRVSLCPHQAGVLADYINEIREKQMEIWDNGMEEEDA